MSCGGGFILLAEFLDLWPPTVGGSVAAESYAENAESSKLLAAISEGSLEGHGD